MAASTWFHGSEWPPGNQGIMPSGNWISAMASTVVATSAASRMPGTSGSCTGRLLRSGQRGGGLGLHDLGGDHAVEGAIGERQGQGVAAGGCPGAVLGGLPGLVHGGDDGQGVEQLVLVAVEGDGSRSASQGLEGVAPAAATEV